MADFLDSQARTLEDMFFAKKDAQLIEKKKQLAKMEHTKKVLGEISGIKNQDVLQKLVEHGVTPEEVTSFSLVPLVEVAWADGKIDEEEREAVLAGAAECKIAKGSVNYELLEQWLKVRPPKKMLEAWTHYIAGLCEFLSKQEQASLKDDLLKRAKKVASAAGGFLGLKKISDEEQAVLDQLEKAFAGK